MLANAEELPFESDSMDGYTIAFGLRNVTRIDAALREAYRVRKLHLLASPCAGRAVLAVHVMGLLSLDMLAELRDARHNVDAMIAVYPRS